jgi:hypothetical protein
MHQAQVEESHMISKTKVGHCHYSVAVENPPLDHPPLFITTSLILLRLDFRRNFLLCISNLEESFIGNLISTRLRHHIIQIIKSPRFEKCHGHQTSSIGSNAVCYFISKVV